MDYKLAKELKDAGWKSENGWRIIRLPNGSQDHLPFPSLKELIYECGESFSGIAQTHDRCFVASSKRPADIHAFTEDTPEEAVSRLWLKLQDDE